MKLKLFIFTLFTSVILTSCGILESTSCSDLNNNFFKENLKHGSEEIFVLADEEKLSVYRAKDKGFTSEFDKLDVEVYPLLSCKEHMPPEISFYNREFNLSLITIPLKFRPAVKGAPFQLNSDTNGALFAGLKKSRYGVNYSNAMDDLYERHISNIEFSYGIFLGVGNTLVSPSTTTDNEFDDEYDGVILQKGVAVFLGYNNFNLGVALGFDNLFGDDRNIWAYKNRPYIGLSIGLDL